MAVYMSYLTEIIYSCIAYICLIMNNSGIRVMSQFLIQSATYLICLYLLPLYSKALTITEISLTEYPTFSRTYWIIVLVIRSVEVLFDLLCQHS